MRKVGLNLIFIAFLIAFTMQGEVWAEDALAFEGSGWNSIESQYCTIHCHPDVDLKKINRKVKLDFFDFIPAYYKMKVENIEEKIGEKFDRLFERVQRILDMFPRKMHLTVAIYKNQKQLDDIYYRTLGPTTQERISYYVHNHTTVYTTEQAISEDVLAHEMAHAVIDHYFLILPPEKIKELLAQYVELHLED